MRRTPLWSLLSLLAVLAACSSASGPSAPAPVSDWTALLAQATAGDTSLDFTRFRIAYTTTALYTPYGRDAARVKREADSLISLGAHQDARQRLKDVLAEVPVDIDLYAMDGYAAAQLGDTAAAEHHRWMIRGLLRSITSSGQGTEASPMVVISVDEEYSLARMLGLRPAGIQSLGTCGTASCDRVIFRQRVGADTTLFFDVSIPQAQFQRALGR